LVARKKVAVLISGSGSNLQALVDACAHPDYPAEIVLVISNKADAYGLTRAKNAGIATHIIRHTDYASRETFDAALHEGIMESGAEIVCLAGFMRLLTADFVNKWPNRMLNIHPSLLPAFKGANAMQDALNAGVNETGCTVHYVVPEMDAGPIIAQARVTIEPNDTLDTLAPRIHAAEHVIYPQALKRVAEGF
jgi:phosphoribosylglycinamide formyltransferase-1